MREKLKGFTVLELLVVIAIIALLASLLFALVNSSRSKSRDAKRIADINGIINALELYFQANRVYPAALQDLVPDYVPGEQWETIREPLGGYYYYFLCGNNIFYLGIELENFNSVALASDRDFPPPECFPFPGFGEIPPGETTNDVARCSESQFATNYNGYCYDRSN